MKEIMEILSPSLGDDLAKDILAHRKGLKCPLTPRGAKSLLREYEATGNAIAAAEHHLNMGWRGFSASWLKGKNFTDPHNPSPRPQSREEYIKAAIQKNQDDWETNERAARVKALIGQATRQ